MSLALNACSANFKVRECIVTLETPAFRNSLRGLFFTFCAQFGRGLIGEATKRSTLQLLMMMKKTEASASVCLLLATAWRLCEFLPSGQVEL